MAKRKKLQRLTKQQFQDFRVLRVATNVAQLDAEEIRIDATDAQVRSAALRLRGAGLLAIREHSAGDKLWRLSLTAKATPLTDEILVATTSQEPQEHLTKEELQRRKDARDVQRREALTEAGDQWDGGGIEPAPFPDNLTINTQTLTSFNARSTAKGLSRILSAEQVETLHPSGQHKVTRAWHHTSHEGYSNARATVTLEVGPSVIDRSTEPMRVESTVDFLDEDWDLLLAPYKQHQREQGISRATDGLYLVAPKWEATRSYRMVHELHGFYQGHITAYNNGYRGSFETPLNYQEWSNNPGGGKNRRVPAKEVKEYLSHPRALLAAETAEMIHDAHPIVIDPEWVEIQEDWTLTEAFAYANRLVLPFDPLYLDLEGVGGRFPRVVVSTTDGKGNTSIKVPLLGCLFWTDQETGRLVVNPIGGPAFLDPVYETQRAMSGFPYEQTGRVLFGGPLYPDGEIVAPLPESSQDTDNALSRHIFSHQIAVGELESEFTAVQLPTPNEMREDTPFGVDRHTIPGYVEIPLEPSEAEAGKQFKNADGIDIAMAYGWNRVLMYQAAKALSLMSLLDNENVELRESTDISRQVRRNAQRKGYGIAKEIVVVRKERYVHGERVEAQDTREYSHQFRVRRHEQHHGPHTPAYRAHPEKAKPCARCGSCRRFIIESYIKGPADKPLKDHKTYVFRDKRDEL